MDTTALVRTDPTTDSEIVQFHNEAVGLLNYANALVILTIDDVRHATNDLSLIANCKKMMEARRKDYLAPFQNHIKEVNSAYQKLMEPIEQADTITRQKITAYQREQTRIAAEQERINNLRMEATKAEAALNNGEIKEEVNLLPVTPVVTKVQADIGNLSTMKVHKWELVDVTKVPAEYLRVDEVTIGKLVRAGISAISGIRIWTEDVLKVSTK